MELRKLQRRVQLERNQNDCRGTTATRQGQTEIYEIHLHGHLGHQKINLSFGEGEAAEDVYWQSGDQMTFVNVVCSAYSYPGCNEASADGAMSVDMGIMQLIHHEFSQLIIMRLQKNIIIFSLIGRIINP